MLIGLILGGILGLLFKDAIPFIKPLGDLFIRLMSLIVVPLIFFSIVSGITSIDNMKKLKRIGGKTLAYYTVTAVIAISIGLLMANIFKPGAGFDTSIIEKADIEESETPTIVETILNMVPTNPVEAFANGDLIQIIIFSVLLGFAIIALGEKGIKVKEFFYKGNDVMLMFTSIILKFAPIGIAALVADTVATYGTKIIGPLGKFLLLDWICMIMIFISVYCVVLKFYVGISPLKFIKRVLPVWGTTISTTSSSATIPVSLDTTTKGLGAPKDIAGFTIPLGATINMDGGACYTALLVMFVAQVYGIEFTITQQLMVVLMGTLISIGAPGIPGGGFVVMVTMLNMFNLPLDLLGIIIAVFRLIDMGHTTINVTGDIVATLAISKSEKQYTSNDFNKDNSTPVSATM